MRMKGTNKDRQQGSSSTIALMVRYMRGCMGFIGVTFLLYIIDVASFMFPPFFQQIYTDNIITMKNPEWYTPLMTFYILLFVLELTAWLYINVLRKRYYSKLNIIASSRFVNCILRMPMSIIEKYSSGELVARYSSIEKISKTIDTFIPAMVLCIRPVLCAWLMMLYSWKLGLVVIFSMLLLLAVMRLTLNTLKKKAKSMVETDAKLQSVTMTGINNLETIKSMGAERVFYSKWDNTYVEALNARVRSAMDALAIGSAPLFAMQFCNALLLCLGTWYILQGELTPGMLLATQGLASSIIYPINKTINSTQKIYQSHAAMERLEEAEAEVKDCNIDIPNIEELPEKCKLKGEIELRDVTFGYDRNLPPVLSHFSMKIEACQSVAFVGVSGCGKSTIAKLISGLYEPWEGEILLDGVPIRQINRSVVLNSLSVVNQDITLFEGTIAENIKMWDDSIEDFTMVMAANDAQIHKDIAERPKAYQATLSENGKNFSGGQRQRIEIATALAKDPTILIMDEGTSALDPKTENLVMQHIRQMGITQVLIAHRLSTIRDCDQIFVMEKGQIVQHGTHNELMQHDGLYSELMKYA